MGPGKDLKAVEYSPPSIRILFPDPETPLIQIPSKQALSRWTPTAMFAAALAFGASAGWGQTPLGPVQGGTFQGLLELPDDEVPMAYVPGSLDRAARLQLRLKAVYHRLATWMKLEEGFKVLVLSPREWQALDASQPYGFPLRVDLSTAAVAAWGTPETVELWRGILGSLPKPGGFSARGSRDEVASLLLADAIVEMELCRTVVHRQQLAGGPEGLWLSDLLGHIVCATADRLVEEPNPTPLLPLLTTAAASGGGAGIPPEAYGDELDSGRWLAYQAHFARGAQLVWEEGGKRAVRRLMRMRRRKGSPLVFEDLLVPFPSLKAWRDSGV